MLLPALTYGHHDDVAARVGRMLTRLRTGEEWADLLLADGTLDPAATPGLLLLDKQEQALAPPQAFHCYLPLALLTEAVDSGSLPAEWEEPVFARSLTSAGALLGLLARANRMWVYPPARHEPFLQAALRHWAELSAEGARYTAGSVHGSDLWSTPNNLRYVLAHHGVPADDLGRPLPAAGPSGLFATDV